ncbi:MAG: hypothetical protein HQK53_18445 [Oligoflexia bacterium]|nr:hypothetical protein [Oligoflexia bacterium]
MIFQRLLKLLLFSQFVIATLLIMSPDGKCAAASSTDVGNVTNMLSAPPVGPQTPTCAAPTAAAVDSSVVEQVIRKIRADLLSCCELIVAPVKKGRCVLQATNATDTKQAGLGRAFEPLVRTITVENKTPVDACVELTKITPLGQNIKCLIQNYEPRSTPEDIISMCSNEGIQSKIMAWFPSRSPRAEVSAAAGTGNVGGAAAAMAAKLEAARNASPSDATDNIAAAPPPPSSGAAAPPPPVRAAPPPPPRKAAAPPPPKIGVEQAPSETYAQRRARGQAEAVGAGTISVTQPLPAEASAKASPADIRSRLMKQQPGAGGAMLLSQEDLDRQAAARAARRAAGSSSSSSSSSVSTPTAEEIAAGQKVADGLKGLQARMFNNWKEGKSEQEINVRLKQMGQAGKF